MVFSSSYKEQKADVMKIVAEISLKECTICFQQQAPPAPNSQLSSTAVSATPPATPAVPSTAVEDPHTINEANVEQMFKNRKSCLNLKINWNLSCCKQEQA